MQLVAFFSSISGRPAAPPMDKTADAERCLRAFRWAKL